MRSLSTITAVAALALALAACSKPAPAPDAMASATSDAAAVATASAATAAALPPPGSYAVTSTDGKELHTTTLNADGTYRMQPVKGLAVAGLVKLTDGKTCFDPSGPATATCYTDSAPAADGSFTATAADGTVVNVKPVAK